MRKFILFFCLLIFISLLSFILFFSPDPVNFHSVTVPGKFSISIPGYLSNTDTLDRTALLQYENDKELLFLLVYEKTDSTQMSPQTLFEKLSADFISRTGEARLIKYYPQLIHLHQAMVGNIRGSVKETGVYYRIAVIEAGSSYYEIIVAVADNHLNGFDEDIDQIIDSFTILR